MFRKQVNMAKNAFKSINTYLSRNKIDFSIEKTLKSFKFFFYSFSPRNFFYLKIFGAQN